MREYTFYQDQKGTIWQRHHFSVKAKSLKEAKQIIAANNLSSDFVGDLADGQAIVFHKSEYLYDTLGTIDPEDNEGYATTIVLDPNHKTVCMNGLDQLIARPLSRDASDEEILKAWEDGPVPDPDEEDEDKLYEVEVYTPDEFAANINDNPCAYGQYYVRFIEITL
mgnify:CR=1 FL=1